MDLQECRRKIDCIDEQLLSLFLERIEVCKDVALYKEAHGMPIHHPKREQEILEKIQLTAMEHAPYATQIYKTIFTMSKQYQKHIVSTDKEGSHCNTV